MVKIILVAHGELAIEFLKSAEMIAGTQNDIYAVPFYCNDGIDCLKDRVRKIVEKLKGDEVIVITDFKGGTPCNVCTMLMLEFNFVLVSGLNLCMLLEAILSRQMESDASVLADNIIKAGNGSIQRITVKKEVK